jgi:two-component system sensor histidine kinase DesK
MCPHNASTIVSEGMEPISQESPGVSQRELNDVSSTSQRMAALQLLYALFVYLPLVLGRGTTLQWTLTIASSLAFIGLYADFFRHWFLRPGRARRDVLGMAGLGFALLPFNVAAVTYVVYAAALAPLAVTPRRAVGLFVVLAIGVAAVMMLSPARDAPTIGAWTISLIFIIGGANLLIGTRERQHEQLRRAREEVEAMATLAERERIARDLHDVLGHTLSVIALKAELAAKLAERDPSGAVLEIQEVERISREALGDVRGAIDGMRMRGLSGELRSAAAALQSAGIRFDTDIERVPLSARSEAALALALREAVTNVLRHARASSCRVALREQDDQVVLTVVDDGDGGPLREGHGLSGMRERIVAAGGTINLDTRQGMAIHVTLPSRPVSTA